MWPLLDGGAVLDSSVVTFTLPLVGKVKLVSSTLFDLGVYVLVIGSVVGALRALALADEDVDRVGDHTEDLAETQP
jgi:multisubunit Na+/H+ antiporter MnhB subunit